jgi:hypothetical protein
VQRDLEGDSVKLREQLQEIREQELEEMVKNSKVVLPMGGSDITYSGKQGVRTLPLLGLAIIDVVVAIVGYLLSENVLLLLIGVLATFIELCLFTIINLIPLQVSIPTKEIHQTSEVAQPTPQKQSGWKGILLQIEGFFVKKAWVNALQSESGRVEEMVQKRLSGQSIDELKSAQQFLQQNVANLRLEVDKLADAEIPPQEYLERRRELDMLKLDKTRLEMDLRSRDDYDSIVDDLQQLALADEMEEPGQGKMELPAEMVPVLGINSLRLDNGELVSEPTRYTELSVEVKYALVIYLRASDWQKRPEVPLVIVDGLTNQPENIKLLLQNKLTELHALGQILRINLLP